MKKIIILTIIFYLALNNVFGQSIFRNFNYGMNPNQVSLLSRTFDQRNEEALIFQGSLPFIAIMNHLYGQMVNPLIYQNITWYSGTLGDSPPFTVPTFLFHSNQLVCVQIFTTDLSTTLSELRNIYGRGISLNFFALFQGVVNIIFETVLFEDNNRYIIWVKHYSEGMEFLASGSVIYANKNWIQDVSQQTNNRINNTEAQRRERARSEID